MDSNVIIGLGVILVGIIWWVASTPAAKAIDAHARIAELINSVKSEAAKKHLREAGKALYDDGAGDAK